MGLRKAWYKVEAWCARVLVMLLAQLPLSFVLGFARVVGCLVFWLWPSRRRVAVENLLRTGVAGTRVEALRLGRASFESFVMLIVESIVARDPKRLVQWDEMVELDVSPEVRALLEEPGRGLIVASAHLGNWEVAARAVSRIKPMCVLYRPVKNPELNTFLHAGRSGENLRYVSRLESDPRRFLVALSQGEIVALMMDQFVHTGRVEVKFLGQPTWTSRSVAMLHMTTRAPLLIAVAVRIGPMKYRVHGLGPIQYTRSGDRETDVRTLMQSVSAEIETLVRRYPDQYLWGHRRWKSHDT